MTAHCTACGIALIATADKECWACASDHVAVIVTRREQVEREIAAIAAKRSDLERTDRQLWAELTELRQQGMEAA
jgi:hypothetical protein